MTVKTLDLSSSNLNDDCLYEIAKFATFIENVDVHNSNFTTESLEMLVKCCTATISKAVRLFVCKGMK